MNIESVNLSRPQHTALEKFKPVYAVLSKPAKHTWKEVSGAIAFAIRKNLGTVSLFIGEKGKPALTFMPTSDGTLFFNILEKNVKLSTEILKVSKEEKAAAKQQQPDTDKKGKKTLAAAVKAEKKVAKADEKAKPKNGKKNK